jgi:GT2 family glycosyltransferase
MNVFAMITTASSARYTDLALESFYAHTPEADVGRFVLIDNDADAPYRLREQYPKISTIANHKPLGFAANANQAVAIARNERADLILLNNDLVFTRNWLAPLCKAETWITSPLSNRELLLKSDQFSCAVEMTVDYYREHQDGFANLVDAYTRTANGFLNVLVLPFFCVRLPYAVLERVGDFDVRYGRGGGEDYDYCLRALQAGLSVKYAQNSFVLHFGGKSSWSGVEMREQQLAREREFFAHFESVWGKPLTDLILGDQHAAIYSDLALKSLVDSGRYSELINRLKS